MRRILIVDDEPKICRMLTDFLRDEGYFTQAATTGDCAKAELDNGTFDLLLSDIRLPGISGVELLAHAKSVSPEIQVILITAYGTISEAVRAIHLGAFDYIEKPFEMGDLGRLVSRAFERTALTDKLRVLESKVAKLPQERSLVARSPAMQRVVELLQKVAGTRSTVMLTGESGSGKELVAETIHNLSEQHDKPFVRVNCPTIPGELLESELFGHKRGAFTGAQDSRKGWFEIADGGTIMLDEIGDLPYGLQSKLLRVLEERKIVRVGGSQEIPIDVRVIAATNLDLKRMVDEKRFREDLYYRLNVFPIAVPPLRERQQDIPELTEALLASIATRIGRPPLSIEPAVVSQLCCYGWPGNARELRNILERACILAGSGPITLSHFPEDLVEETSCDHACRDCQAECLVDRVDQYRIQLIVEALDRCDWVKKDAAEALGLTPRALSHYISKFDIDRFHKS